MSRSPRASRNCPEISLVIGTGAPIGPRVVISTLSLIPRSVKWSWRSRAASKGAGGHLNGRRMIAIAILPESNPEIASRIRSAPATV